MARTITYSKNVFLPLTHVCANACGYCGFKTPVNDDCILTPEEGELILQRGQDFGCTEALFTFGERPDNVSGFSKYIKKIGFDNILSYCIFMSKKAITYGLLPHTNAGILTYEEMEMLRPFNASMGLMLETTAEVYAHRNSPGKDPAIRLEMIENAGKLKIPFTTGLLLGIGESSNDHEESLQAIRDIHKKYKHIQEVIIQNFSPQSNTEMKHTLGATTDMIRDTIIMASEILPRDISIQIPPNLTDASSLLSYGVTDLGGISPVTIDYINPDHPWPAFEELQSLTQGYELRERLCIYPQYCNTEWVDEQIYPLVHKLSRKSLLT